MDHQPDQRDTQGISGSQSATLFHRVPMFLAFNAPVPSI